jgi:hypothetical protein
MHAPLATDAIYALVQHVIGQLWLTYDGDEMKQQPDAPMLGKQRRVRRGWLS